MAAVAVFTFVFIVAASFVSAVVFVFASAVKRELQANKKSLELPEWTGRERRNLWFDLEAAKRYPPHRNRTWGYCLEHYPLTSRDHIKKTAPKYGLFPEALEAFIEGQEKSS